MREREDANRTREAGHLDEIQGVVANRLKMRREGAACRVLIFTLVGFIGRLGASAATIEDVMQQPEKALDSVDLSHPRLKAKR